MKKPIIAALLSALLFPGTGHFYLKRYQRGLIFFVPTLLSLTLLVRAALTRAYAIAEQIEQGQVPLDPAAIGNLISAQSAEAGFTMLDAASWVILICWIAGIIDSFRLGKQTDREGSR